MICLIIFLSIFIGVLIFIKKLFKEPKIIKKESKIKSYVKQN